MGATEKMSPIYEWKCPECGSVIERFSATYDPSPPDCPKCSASTVRLISLPQFKFIGAGFHCNDYHEDRPKTFDEFCNGTQDTREWEKKEIRKAERELRDVEGD